MSAPAPSCAGCARAHLVRRPGLSPAEVLQCRARPPVTAGAAPWGAFPWVRADDFCLIDFQPGEPRALDAMEAADA
jgi:hypothetical protein